jgi:hypothetical protein
MKTNPAKKNLLKAYPLLDVSNNLEFKQRLAWLSEGMLRNHMESVINYKKDPQEIEAYLTYRSFS